MGRPPLARSQDTNGGGLHGEGLHMTPLHEEIHTTDGPEFAQMSDAEMLAFIESTQPGSRYEVPPGVEPDGMKYQWITCSVLGQPDQASVTEAERRGLRAVPSGRHPGMWMARDADPTTPIVLGGLMLMEQPHRLYEMKLRVMRRDANAATDGMQERLRYGPSERSAPRDAHPSTMPSVRRGEEWIQTAIKVE